jgi:hypothetical protein
VGYITYNPSTKTINIAPPNTERNNSYTVTISLSNEVNPLVIRNFDVQIFNNPPIYIPNLLPDQTVHANDNNYYYQPSANDPENNVITYSLMDPHLICYFSKQ